jgi:hypothetical protein
MLRFEVFVKLNSVAETALAHVTIEKNGPADDGCHRFVNDLRHV